VQASLRRVLAEGAIETPIQRVIVNTLDDAEFLRFPGSPTVRLNGEDLVPVPPGEPASLACRLYGQPDGSVAGTIPEETMRAAIRRLRRGRYQAFQREEAALHRAAEGEAAEHDGEDSP
jgi:hypothetical protein